MSEQFIDIWIPGTPKAKQSMKMAVIAGHAKAYQPAKVENYQAWLKKFIYDHMVDNGKEKFADGTPLCLKVFAVWEYPKSWSKKKRAATKYKVSRPDTDNIEKPIKDAMNELVYKDDSMVVDAHTMKVYGPEAGLRIMVWEKT